MTTPKYPSRILQAVHESVSELFAGGSIDAKTMKKFDELCLAEFQAKQSEACSEHGVTEPIH
jgi:DNA-binding transcriptional regulator YiaG